MLKLYYSPGACSLVTHIALEEVDLEYEAIAVPIAEGANLRPDYLAINPRGRVPALAVDDTVITENIAILNYLALLRPDSCLIPLKNPLQAARCNELLAFFAATVHTGFGQLWRPQRFHPDARFHEAIKDGGREAIITHFDTIDQTISSHSWLIGDGFTIADAYLFVFYRWGKRIGLDMTIHRNWSRHTRQMLDRKAVQRAIAAEGLSASEFVN